MELWLLGRALSEIKEGRYPSLMEKYVRALHQVPMAPREVPARILGSLGLASDLDTSVPLIQRVEELIGTELPKVLFLRELQGDPEADVQLPKRWEEIKGEGKKYIQPDPETYFWLGQQVGLIRDPIHYLDLVLERGMDGMVIDTNHSDRPHKHSGLYSELSRWGRTYPRWLHSGKVSHCHLRLGSIDMPSRGREYAVNELLDMLDGGVRTSIRTKLRWFLEYERPVVVEVLPAAYSAIKTEEGKKGLITPSEFIDLLCRINDTIRKVDQEVQGRTSI